MFVQVDKMRIFFGDNLLITVLECFLLCGVKIPHLCFHRLLNIAGNCRVCLTFMKNERKPIISCLTFVRNNMDLTMSNSYYINWVRSNVFFFILLNHPLDCPVCDQVGLCDLQNIVDFYSVEKKVSIYVNKHVFYNVLCSKYIKTVMMRCIHCLRCVRLLFFFNVFNWGVLGRGYNMFVGNYTNNFIFSNFIGNIVDLCPVGALTFKNYIFEKRSWDFVKKYCLNFLSSLGGYLVLCIYNSIIYKVSSLRDDIFKNDYLSDFSRFFFDILLKQRIVCPLYKFLSFKNYKFMSWSVIWQSVYYYLLNFNIKNIGVCLGFTLDFYNLLYIKQYFLSIGVCNFYSDVVGFNDFNNFYICYDLKELCLICSIFLLVDCAFMLLNDNSFVFFKRSILLNNSCIYYSGFFFFDLKIPFYFLGLSLFNFYNIYLGYFFKFLNRKDKRCFIVFNSYLLQFMFYKYFFIVLLSGYLFIDNLFLKIISLNSNYVMKQFINVYCKNIKRINILKIFFFFEFCDICFNNCLSNSFVFFFGSILHAYIYNYNLIFPIHSVLERNYLFLNINGDLFNSLRVLKGKTYYGLKFVYLCNLISVLFYKFIGFFFYFRFFFKLSFFFKLIYNLCVHYTLRRILSRNRNSYYFNNINVSFYVSFCKTLFNFKNNVFYLKM